MTTLEQTSVITGESRSPADAEDSASAIFISGHIQVCDVRCKK